MMTRQCLCTIGAALALVCFDTLGADLEPPVPILSGGAPIDVEHSGHAAPFVGDFDGDGRKDLLVGEFYQGRLRIYRNVGDNAEPRFEGFAVFQNGAPGGCIWAS